MLQLQYKYEHTYHDSMLQQKQNSLSSLIDLVFQLESCDILALKK